MKKVLLLASSLALLGMSQASFADSMKVGVVDLPTIIQQSAQVKSINDKLRSQFSSQQQEIVNAQTKMQTEAKKLSGEDGSKLTDQQKKDLQDNVMAEQKQLQKMVVSFQEDVSKAQNDAMKRFMGEVNDTVKTIAKKEGLGIVLLKPAVIYADNTVDITSKVIAELPQS